MLLYLVKPICLIDCQVINSEIRPSSQQKGIQLINSTLINVTLQNSELNVNGFLAITGCTVMNLVGIFGTSAGDSQGYCAINVQRSSIRTASLLFVTYKWCNVLTYLTFEDSTLNNILIKWNV